MIGITNRLTSAEEKADEQKTLNSEVDKLKAAGKARKKIQSLLVDQCKIFKDEIHTMSTKVTTFALLSLVNTKVAFSATIIESKDVFTGPKTATTSSTLIFNKVFTNVGNAYNSKTGMNYIINLQKTKQALTDTLKFFEYFLHNNGFHITHGHK